MGRSQMPPSWRMHNSKSWMPPSVVGEHVRPSDRLLEFLRGTKCNLLAGCDLHHLASGWIAPRACLTLAHLKRSQSTDPDAVTLLQVVCDTIDQPTQQILSQLLGQLMPFHSTARRRPQAQPLSISVLRVSIGIEPQPTVLARHNNEPGVSKANRPYSGALGSEQREDDIWFLVPPAPGRKAGTRAIRSIQGSTGKKL
jgi:hypothetical protein